MATTLPGRSREVGCPLTISGLAQCCDDLIVDERLKRLDRSLRNAFNLGVDPKISAGDPRNLTVSRRYIINLRMQVLFFTPEITLLTKM